MSTGIRDLAWLVVSAETLTTGNLSKVLDVLDNCGTLFLAD